MLVLLFGCVGELMREANISLLGTATCLFSVFLSKEGGVSKIQKYPSFPLWQECRRLWRDVWAWPEP